MTIEFDNPAEQALSVVIEALFDQATAFTCDEIEALVTAYRHMGYGATADALIEYHAAEDDEGDMHVPEFDDNLMVVGWHYNESEDN